MNLHVINLPWTQDNNKIFYHHPSLFPSLPTLFPFPLPSSSAPLLLHHLSRSLTRKYTKEDFLSSPIYPRHISLFHHHIASLPSLMLTTALSLHSLAHKHGWKKKILSLQKNFLLLQYLAMLPLSHTSPPLSLFLFSFTFSYLFSSLLLYISFHVVQNNLSPIQKFSRVAREVLSLSTTSPFPPPLHHCVSFPRLSLLLPLLSLLFISLVRGCIRKFFYYSTFRSSTSLLCLTPHSSLLSPILALARETLYFVMETLSVVQGKLSLTSFLSLPFSHSLFSFSFLGLTIYAAQKLRWLMRREKHTTF